MIEWVEAGGGFLVSYVPKWLPHEMGGTSHNTTESMGLDSRGRPPGSSCSQIEHYDGVQVSPIQYGIEDFIGIGIISFPESKEPTMTLIMLKTNKTAHHPIQQHKRPKPSYHS
jgi:hypothetical protein